jgi:hypothetical protein
VSTTTRPVTHTALTEVNRESSQDKCPVCTLCSINNPDPSRIITMKLVEKINPRIKSERVTVLIKPQKPLNKETICLYLSPVIKIHLNILSRIFNFFWL